MGRNNACKSQLISPVNANKISNKPLADNLIANQANLIPDDHFKPLKLETKIKPLNIY
jgi:hypothetical protein